VKMKSGEQGKVLSAPYVLEYTYRRSVGPVVGRFLAALQEGKILGGRTASGKVVVPPTEYDPETSDPVTDLVEVGTSGVVTTWSWAAAPRAHQPLDRPFAWALIQLDGADTAMLHAVDAGDAGKMSTGMRVKARFAAENSGTIRDIVCFEPEASGQGAR
jgi:uncharacterized OB-fold protein